MPPGVGYRPEQSEILYRRPDPLRALNQPNRGGQRKALNVASGPEHTKRPPSVRGDLCSILVDNDNHNHVGAPGGIRTPNRFLRTELLFR